MAVNSINEVVRLKHNLEAAGMAKRGRPPKFSAAQFYPRALENDLNDALRAELMRLNGEFTAAALVGINDSVIADDLGDLNAVPVTLSAGFLERTQQIGERIAEFSGRTFSQQMEGIIGRPYYPPGAQPEILNAWHEEFQTLCISAAQDGKKAIAATVAVAKEQGWNKGQLEAQIEKILPLETKHRAELIARTETGKLNSRCTIATYEHVGIKYYRWLTTMDGRERETHAELNGVICSVENGEIYFTENPDNPLRPVQHDRTPRMYHGHPGTDFQCRCSMVMWDPEINGSYEVKEDQKREEEKRLEAEEKARQEAEEKRRQEQEAEQARKRAEAEAKARAEFERKAREEAERKTAEARAKAEAERKKAEAKAAKATAKNESILKAAEKAFKAEEKAYKNAEKTFKETYKDRYKFRRGTSQISIAKFVVNKDRFSEEIRKAAQALIDEKKKFEIALESADAVFKANGDMGYMVAQYLKKTEKEYQDAYKKIWENGDPRIKALYMKVKNEGVNTPTDRSGFYSPSNNSITLGKSCRKKNLRGISATLWHEMGHNTHFSLGNPLYKRLDDLQAAADKDLKPFYDLLTALDEKRAKLRSSGDLEAWFKFSVKNEAYKTDMFKEFFEVGKKIGGPDAIHGIYTDIAEGFSGGKFDLFYRGFYGHGGKYWISDKNNKAEEFWAEMFEAYMRPEIKDTLKKYIPNMMKIFEEEIDKLQ